MMFVRFANMQISITANTILKAEVLMHSCAIIAQQYVNWQYIYGMLTCPSNGNTAILTFHSSKKISIKVFMESDC